MNLGKYLFGVRKSKLIASTLRIGKARAQNTFEFKEQKKLKKIVLNQKCAKAVFPLFLSEKVYSCRENESYNYLISTFSHL